MRYQIAAKKQWTGRIDQDEPIQARRWHQIVQFLDLNHVGSIGHELTKTYGLIGYASDLGIALNQGRIGAYKGPDAVRAALSFLPIIDDYQLLDAGNISSADATVEELQQELSVRVAQLIQLNIKPIVIGGGHDVAFGTFRGAVMSIPADKNWGIINMDAHFDIRKAQNHNSGTPFLNIYDLLTQKARPFDYLCLGIQDAGNTQALFNRAKELKISYLTDEQIQRNSEFAINQIENFIRDKDKVYLSIDLDVLNVSYAPGVSATNPFGLDPWQLLQMISIIANSGKLAVVDIAELNPDFDRDNQTTRLAARLVQYIMHRWA